LLTRLEQIKSNNFPPNCLILVLPIFMLRIHAFNAFSGNEPFTCLVDLQFIWASNNLQLFKSLGDSILAFLAQNPMSSSLIFVRRLTTYQSVGNPCCLQQTRNSFVALVNLFQYVVHFVSS